MKLADYFEPAYARLSQRYRRYEELDCELRQITGLTLTQLKDRFLKGWTLQPPEPETRSLSELFDTDT